MVIEWKQTYAVGVEEIDRQHQELFQRVNKLFDACNQGKGKDEIQNTLSFLQEYVITHFKTEEDLQLKSSYSAYEQHKGQHQQFIQDFLELKKKIAEDGANVNTIMQVNKKVVDWLIHHIGNSDKAFGKYLSERS